MKIYLASCILVIVYFGTSHANAYEDVNEFYDQCMPLIEIVENDNFDEIDNMDSESVLMSSVCLGYIMGMLEGVQVGWASNRDVEKYCDNTKNVMDIFKLFTQDLKANPAQKNSDLQNFFYNFLYSQICEQI